MGSVLTGQQTTPAPTPQYWPVLRSPLNISDQNPNPSFDGRYGQAIDAGSGPLLSERHVTDNLVDQYHQTYPPPDHRFQEELLENDDLDVTAFKCHGQCGVHKW
jgi:hypothetical protein